MQTYLGLDHSAPGGPSAPRTVPGGFHRLAVSLVAVQVSAHDVCFVGALIIVQQAGNFAVVLARLLCDGSSAVTDAAGRIYAGFPALVPDAQIPGTVLQLGVRAAVGLFQPLAAFSARALLRVHHADQRVGHRADVREATHIGQARIGVLTAVAKLSAVLSALAHSVRVVFHGAARLLAGAVVAPAFSRTFAAVGFCVSGRHALVLARGPAALSHAVARIRHGKAACGALSHSVLQDAWTGAAVPREVGHVHEEVFRGAALAEDLALRVADVGGHVSTRVAERLAGRVAFVVLNRALAALPRRVHRVHEGLLRSAARAVDRAEGFTAAVIRTRVRRHANIRVSTAVSAAFAVLSALAHSHVVV